MSLKSSVITRFFVKMTYFDHGCRPWLLTKKWSKSKKKLKKYQIRVHFHLTISGSSHEPKKLGPNSFYGQLSIWWRFDTSSILVFTVLSILPISRLKIKYFENKILKSKTTQKSSILFHTYSILNPYIFHTRIHAQSILNPYIIHTNFHTASILHPYLFHAKSILIPRLFHEFLSDTSSVSAP